MKQTAENVPAKKMVDAPSKRKGRRSNEGVQGFSRSHTLAMEIAIAVIAPTLAGRWLDSKTGKDPWFTIAGLVLGFAATIRSVHRFHGESQQMNESGGKSSEVELSE
jgi:F0F1-type ATP synthase assembly protein I